MALALQSPVVRPGRQFIKTPQRPVKSTFVGNLEISKNHLFTGPRSARNVTRMGLFGLGAPEIAVIVGVVALVYGPSKLPEVGKGLGKTFKSFQTAAKEFEKELKEEMKDENEVERKTENPEKKEV